MFERTKAFSGFSVNDLAAAKAFYSEKLGLGVEGSPMGLWLKIEGSHDIFVYGKDNHQPATYTMLNFPVDDVDRAVNELTAKGVQFEHYEGMTDERGIARGDATGRPDIAWFKDPAGNIIAVLHER